MESEKQYVEVKVSFIHIVVLLVGVIVIGIFLFYLGYQAGKSSARNQILQAELPKSGKSDEIQLVDKDDKIARNTAESNEPSIKDEIKLHQLPTTSTPTSTPPSTSTSTTSPAADDMKTEIKAKPLQKENFFSVQVGAFSDYTNAKNYSAKFAKLGYPTEINTTTRNNKNLYRVRVGSYKTRAEAQAEMKKLEKMENKRFTVTTNE